MAITITKQPTNVTAVVGDSISFSVVAEGEGLTYQWEWRTVSNSQWTASTLTGNNTATLTVGAEERRNGYMYRCIITDANGDSINTNIVVLTVLTSLPEKGLIDLSIMQDIANAVREKTGKTDPMQPADMATEIGNISGGVKMVKYTIDIKSTLGNGTNTTYTMLEADEFVKENFTKEGFTAIFVPAPRISTNSSNTLHGIYHGNRNIGASNYTRYGVAYYNTSATIMSVQPITSMLSANGTTLSFRAKSNGDLILYVSSSRKVDIGTYNLWMCCIE